jgi:cob(I)alamin adenosyltransferase
VRHAKDDVLFETLGDIDELSSHIGVIRRRVSSKEHNYRSAQTVQAILNKVQTRLQDIMSLIATDPKIDYTMGSVPKNERYLKLKQVTEDDVVKDLEDWVKAMLKGGVKIENNFILPGSSVDVARAVCRRAERKLVGFMRDKTRPDLRWSSVYLNRLSDALFTFARFLEQNSNLVVD